jgi:hypothetical protein
MIFVHEALSPDLPRHPTCPAGIPAASYYTEFKMNANPYLPGDPFRCAGHRPIIYFRRGNFPLDSPFGGYLKGLERTSDMPSIVHPRNTMAEKITLVAISVISWPLEKFIQLIRKCLKWFDDLELLVL